MITADPIQDVLSRFQKVKELPGNQWEARCPAHDDNHASLSIGIGRDGKAIVHCHAGCTIESICSAVGMKVRDLFPPRDNHYSNGNGARPTRSILKVYPYVDAEGQLQFEVVRYTDKDFRQRRPDGSGGWIWNLKDVRLVPYRLPELLNAFEDDPEVRVFIAEGEKDVDNLRAAGLVATCNSGGALKWKPEHAEYLRRRHVVILPDNDLTGRDHGILVGKSVRPIAASVKIIDLPGLPPKGDVSDYLAAGGTAEAIQRLVDETPEWVPLNQVEQALGMADAPAADAPRQLLHSDTSFEMTDVGNACRLISRHKEKLRHCTRFGKWFCWSGKRYELDESGIVDQCQIETIRAMKADAARLVDDAPYAARLFKHALQSESNRKIKDAIERASKLPGVFISPDELDRDPWLLNVNNGTLDLRTGQMREHRRVDLITKLAPAVYSPSATCPMFLATLDRIFDGKDQLIQFWQRVMGYSLTGLTTERCLFILWGSGANGKSTLLAVLRLMLGDYAIQTPASSLMAKKHDAIPNDIARLKGARVGNAVESDEGRRLAEGLIKQLTGGEDLISARFMRGEWFDFKPEFKIFLATNHRPEIRGSDDGIWDRVKLIPFNVRIPEAERDAKLLDKLWAELPGILAWSVQGCLDWQRDGLGTPDEVRAAVEEYRETMDRVGEFITDCCVVDVDAQALATDLFETFKTWCTLRGEEPMNQTRFGRQLEDRGYSTSREGGTGKTLRNGIGIRISAPI